MIRPPRGEADILTTDCLVEGVHFRREWTPALAIGHKALAVSLSDLAAMGAVPRASLLSLALPEQLPVSEFDALVEGVTALAELSGATLIGGNLTRSPGPVVIEVTALGSVRPRRVLRRDTARPGDHLYVTGSLGTAAAGLAMVRSDQPRQTLDELALACVSRYERPDARWRCGSIVGRTGSASAAMDVSDGLAATARAIAEASRLGVVVEADALPIHPGARAWFAQAGEDPVTCTLSGGEDYELAFSVSPRLRSRFLAASRRCRNLSVTRVGRFTAAPGAWLERKGLVEPLPAGFTHF